MKLYNYLAKIGEINPVDHWEENYNPDVVKEEKKEKTNLVIIWGGSASARTYTLRLVEAEFNLSRKIVFYLPEVEDSLWQLFSFLPDTLQIIFWSKNSIEEEVLAKMLVGFGRLLQKTVILDPTDEVRKVWGKSKGRSALRRQIDCTMPISEPDSMEKIYTRWFEGMEGFDASPRLLEHAISRPFSESFNMVQTLKLVGEKNLNLITAQKWGMLWTDEEQYFIETLLIKGRGAVLKTAWSGLNASKTLFMLYKRVHLLLKVKTLEMGYTSEKLKKLELSEALYFKLKDQTKKMELKALYKRLYLVTSLLKWRTRKGVLNLLMMYW